MGQNKHIPRLGPRNPRVKQIPSDLTNVSDVMFRKLF